MDNEEQDPVERFGAAARPDRPVEHERPAGMDDATVEALGKVSEALEIVEHARGLLYAFHRHCGMADLTLQDAVTQLRRAGHSDVAAELETVLVGRDIIEDRWSFQVVESYDRTYWQVFRAMEQRARHLLGDAEPHIFEAEMRVREQQDPPS